MVFVKKLKAGWGFLQISSRIFFSRKEFLLFPFLKTITFAFFGGCLALLIHYFVGWQVFEEFLSLFGKESLVGPSFADFLFLLSIGFCLHSIACFIYSFFTVALCHFIRDVINHNTISASRSFKHAIHRLPAILFWSLFSSSIMLILNIINGILEKCKLRFLGKIFTFLGEMAWSMATFFIYPILAFEDLGTINNVKRSSQIIRTAFGETVVGIFGFHLFPLLLFIPLCFFSFFSTIALYSYVLKPFNIIPLSTLGIMSTIFLPSGILIYLYFSFMYTLQTIFATAVYGHLTKQGEEIFSLQVIKEQSKR